MTEEVKFCDCGHWYNTSVKCPECNTVATKTLEEIRTQKNKTYYIKEITHWKVDAKNSNIAIIKCQNSEGESLYTDWKNDTKNEKEKQ